MGTCQNFGSEIVSLTTTQGFGIKSKSGYQKTRKGVYSVDTAKNAQNLDSHENKVDAKPHFENIKIMKSSNCDVQVKQNAIYTIPIREYVDLPPSRNRQRQAKKESCKTFSTINTQN